MYVVDFMTSGGEIMFIWTNNKKMWGRGGSKMTAKCGTSNKKTMMSYKLVVDAKYKKKKEEGNCFGSTIGQTP